MINKNYLIGIMWFIASLAVSIANDTCMKYLSTSLPPMQITFLRFSFGCLSLLPIMLLNGVQSFYTARKSIHFARGLILFLAMSIWCYGLTIVPIVHATLTTFTIPLFLLLLAPIFLKEKISKPLLLATIAGFIGAVISFDVMNVDFEISSMILLISACLFAFLDVINKRFVQKESMLSMLFYSALVTSALGFIPAYMVWQNPSFDDLLILFYLGAGGNAILYCLLKAFSLVPASSIAPYRYLELIFSSIVGFVIFTEIPTIMMLLGSMLIIPSTLFITFSKTKES
ncbi:MAG: DMT family transporter [Candidatus Jidaibacter sp.]|jgi:S-adenosylmethionine uptake transporter|nr:DMT family transporter [Candidatus Jidaibacter sp.]